ncbi:MAG: Ig-like domain-containing protein, partial [Rubrobacter sp.]
TTVRLVRTVNTTAVGASLSYPAPNRVVLNPTNPLVRGANYRVTIVGGTSGARDLAGNTLAANVS